MFIQLHKFYSLLLSLVLFFFRNLSKQHTQNSTLSGHEWNVRRKIFLLNVSPVFHSNYRLQQAVIRACWMIWYSRVLVPVAAATTRMNACPRSRTAAAMTWSHQSTFLPQSPPQRCPNQRPRTTRSCAMTKTACMGQDRVKPPTITHPRRSRRRRMLKVGQSGETWRVAR